MFVDGITYGAISRNLAEGIGTLDTPSYSAMYSDFHEHPPFFFWVQGLLFWLLGDQFFMERLSGILMGLGGLAGIYYLQRVLFLENHEQKQRYLSILIWVSIPLISWTYNSNMLENLLIILTLYASGFYLDGYLKGQWWKIVLGSAFLVLGFLTKGFVALFPLSVIPLHFIFLRKKDFKSTLNNTLVAGVSLGVIAFALALVYPDLLESIQLYFKQQLMPSLEGKRDVTTGNRFQILLDLLAQISIPLIITVLLFIWRRIKRVEININWKQSLFLAAVGLSASLPLMVTLKQRPFYLLPGLPYFALAFFTLIVPHLTFNIHNLNSSKWLRYTVITLWIAIITLPIVNYGTYSRNKEMIMDVDSISASIPEQTVIGGPVDVWQNWGLHAYLARIGHIGLKCSMSEAYIILPKDDPRKSTVPATYKVVELNLNHYTIWKKAE